MKKVNFNTKPYAEVLQQNKIVGGCCVNSPLIVVVILKDNYKS